MQLKSLSRYSQSDVFFAHCRNIKQFWVFIIQVVVELGFM